MAKDPVCGMEVEAEKAVEAEFNSLTYYFCSEACRDKFEENPQLHLKEGPIEE